MPAAARLLFATTALSAALASDLPASLAAPAQQAPPKAVSYTLKNGLQLVVVPDHRAPVVTHMVWYRVGGADDPPGQSGTAHFFEHLMFRGTKAVPNGELSKTVARNGGQDNAQTSEDFTVYFQRIAKDRLPLMMQLEADRMVNLDLSESNLTTERDVVLEERHLRIDSEPRALAEEQMEAALHLSHPYGRPVIGWEAEIKRITRADALDFYQHHYAPNNATVIVAGDVKPEDVLKLAQQKYEPVAPHMLAPRMNEPAPPRLAPARLNIAIPGTKLPQFIRYYRVPGYVDNPRGTAESLEIMTSILGGGSTSRLYRTLVVDKKLAVDAGANYDGRNRGPSELMIFAVPREGVSFSTLETAVDQVLATLDRGPPETGEFERAKTKLVADYTYEHDNQFLLAQDYGQGLSIGLTITDIEDWPNRIRAVTAPDVRNVAQRYLIPPQSVTGLMEAR
jgi:zinc protease